MKHSVYQFVHLSKHLTVYSFSLSKCLNVYLSNRLSAYSSNCLTVYLSKCLNVYSSNRLSAYSSNCLTVYLSKCLIVFLSLCLLVSCDYKDLCYDHNHWSNLTVRMDWQKAPLEHPQGMTVQFYRQDGTGEPERYDLVGSDGGTVRLLPGGYRPFTYNNDTETILFRGMSSIATLEAYTRVSSVEEGTQMHTRSQMPRPESTEAEPVILEPDPICGTAGEPFVLEAEAAQTITLQPGERYRMIHITIHNVPNLQYTGQFGAALSGLASSIFMESGQPGEGLATQAVSVQVAGDSTLTMSFRTFGHCPHLKDEGKGNEHLLTVYAILADGTQWFYSQDVTEEMHDVYLHPEEHPGENPDDYEIYIELDELPLPKPIVNGSGFQPTIDGWQGVEIEVDM